MFLSRIIRLLIKIYFNSYRLKSSSLLFNSKTIRHIEYSLKMIIAFIISGLISYGSPLHYYLDQQYIICVISILSIQETFGLTLYSSIQTTIAIVPLSNFTFSYSNYWSFISSIFNN